MKKIMFGAMVLIGLSISASALLMDSKLDGIEVIPNNECKEGYVLVNTRDTVSKAVCYNSCEDLGIRVVALENAIDCSGEDLSGEVNTGNEDLSGEVTTEGNESTRLAADNTCEGGFNNQGLQDPELTVQCLDINTTALSEGYLDLTEAKGMLAFIGGSYSDISNLKNLTEADGGLAFANNENLISLAGLENLESVGAFVSHNTGIINLDELKSLISVTGFGLQITLNEDLVNVDGLSSLTNIEGALALNYSPSLIDISGLSSLTNVGGDFQMANNSSLISTSGLNSLTSVGAYFDISKNSSLTSLSGLNSLTSVGESFNVSENPSLTSLSGLNSLTSVGGIFVLNNNPNLKDISALNNITEIGDYVWFDDKEYEVKLDANSYICQNYDTKVAFKEKVLKSNICNN